MVDKLEEVKLEELSPAEKREQIFRQIIERLDETIEGLRKSKDVILAPYRALQAKNNLCIRDFSDCLRDGNRSFSVGAVSIQGLVKQLVEVSPAEAKEWFKIDRFISHDIRHIGETELYEHAKQLACILDIDYNTLLPDEWQIFYQEKLERIENIFEQLFKRFIASRTIAQLALGEEVTDIEEVDITSMVDVLIHSLQVRFVFDDFALSTPENRQLDRNEMVADIEEGLSLKTNPGMFFQLLFCLEKNAGKEMSVEEGIKSDDCISPLEGRSCLGELPKTPNKLHVKVHSIKDRNVTVVHVMDSGDGLRADEILDSIKELLNEGLIEESDLKGSVRKVLTKWKDNPFAVRTLKLGDVYDMAALARVSGFLTRMRGAGESSGMGLWGLQFLMKTMGAQAIYTNTVDAGALFTLIIPNDYFSASGDGRDEVAGEVLELRKAVEEGFVDSRPPLVA